MNSLSPSNNNKLSESSLLDQEELDLNLKKLYQKNQYIFAIMLKFFESEGLFPTPEDYLPGPMIEQIFWQLNYYSPVKFVQGSRTYERFRKEIRQYFGYRACSTTDRQALVIWLIQHAFPEAPTWEQVQEQAYEYFREHKLEPFSNKQFERLLRSAHCQFESNFFRAIEGSLSTNTKYALDFLIKNDQSEDSVNKAKDIDFKLSDLKKESAELKINSILEEVRKYRQLCRLNIPQIIKSFGSQKLFLKYYKRVKAELPSHIEAHLPHIRYA